MSYHGYAKLGCDELWNNSRTYAYACAGIKPSAGTINDCGCPGFGDALGETYTVPDDNRNPAPWYDPNVPQSGDFGGLLVTSVEGLSDSPMTRTVTEGVGDGAVLGRPRVGPRYIRVVGVLVGRTCCGVDYGKRWLVQQARGCGHKSCGGTEACETDSFTFYSCCPEEPELDPARCACDVGCSDSDRLASCPYQPTLDEVQRCLRNAAITDGPRTIEKLGTGCGACGSCAYEVVEFTIVAGEPWLYTMPTVALDAVPIPLAQNDDVECVTWCREGASRVELLADTNLSDCANHPGWTQFQGAFCTVGSGVAINAGGPTGTGGPRVQSDPTETVSAMNDYTFTYTFTVDNADALSRLRVRVLGANSGDAYVTRVHAMDAGGTFTVAVPGTLFANGPEPLRVTFDVDPGGGGTGQVRITNASLTEDGSSACDCDGTFDCEVHGSACDLTDPSCRERVDPPTLPTITAGCLCEPLARATRCERLDRSALRNHFEAVPVIEVYSGSKSLRGLRFTFHQVRDDEDCATFDGDEHRCDACAEVNVSYLPADTTLVIDGRTRTIRASCPGNGSVSGTGVVFGQNGSPFRWPTLSCRDYCVCLSVDALSNGGPADNARASIELVGREM